MKRVAGATHHYETTLVWTGAHAEGTTSYRSYRRDHEVEAEGRPAILGSSDPAFRGDPGRWNPEQLLVAALSQCHMLAYLHLCAVSDVVVLGYEDRATGVMVQSEDGGGHFTEASLRPVVTVAEESMTGPARTLHDRAHRFCFIASSVNFPVRNEPEIRVV